MTSRRQAANQPMMRVQILRSSVMATFEENRPSERARRDRFPGVPCRCQGQHELAIDRDPQLPFLVDNVGGKPAPKAPDETQA